MSEINELIQALRAAISKGDDEKTEQAAQGLIAVGEKAVPTLLALSRENNTETRWWALRDPDPAVWLLAALGLRHQPTSEAIPDLIALLSGKDRLLASIASDALAAVGKDATAPLIEVLQNGTPAAKIEAARAPAQPQDKNSISAFFEAFDSPSSFVERWANEGLERTGVGTVFFVPAGDEKPWR